MYSNNLHHHLLPQTKKATPNPLQQDKKQRRQTIISRWSSEAPTNVEGII